MAEQDKPLLIKRYASRRLYNTETSDYVTLEDIAGFIRDGREVQILDLKTGDDLTRQYLLQIIAEHESRGENVLPVNVLNATSSDTVRSRSWTGKPCRMLKNEWTEAWAREVVTLPFFAELEDGEVLEFVDRSGVRLVTAHRKRFNWKLARDLHRRGARILVHTVNEPEKVRKLLERGADGFYTDFLAPSDVATPGAEP